MAAKPNTKWAAGEENSQRSFQGSLTWFLPHCPRWSRGRGVQGGGGGSLSPSLSQSGSPVCLCAPESHSKFKTSLGQMLPESTKKIFTESTSQMKTRLISRIQMWRPHRPWDFAKQSDSDELTEPKPSSERKPHFSPQGLVQHQSSPPSSLRSLFLHEFEVNWFFFSKVNMYSLMQERERQGSGWPQASMHTRKPRICDLPRKVYRSQALCISWNPVSTREKGLIFSSE